MIRTILAGLICATALAGPAQAQTYETDLGAVILETHVEGLEHPWGLAFLPDGGMLVTERPGRLRHVAADGTISEPITGVPQVDNRGQGGLLDVALDPDFASNRFVYLSYAEPGQGGTTSTAVARGTLSDDTTTLGGLEVIFSQRPKVQSTLHYGSRLVFDGNGHLFITTGERSADRFRVQAQDLNSHLGKVIRIHPDGAVPHDNPFVGQQGALPEIWSYGHRNIQGAALHPQTGALWINEHGPRGGDELNRIEKGGNYGWPLVTEGTEYSGAPIDPPADLPPGLIDPVAFWVPSPAPSGLTFYDGGMFPAWQGDAFMGALAGTSLIRVDMDGTGVVGEEFMFTELGMRIRDVVEGPDGALYLLTDAANGKVLRISPAEG
ncbi:PQQ-dependent sugar dehydrogenase [Pelagibacterium xiamenense]|uniref:PQQ-dependent sugar dehydrogenase n=1 Tax=Pelagibacterium xiamenense TaxID=2901140 RepID=UPI001E3F5E77|nr:PQQ-dependent sugar dehydrogenase [Pelagibacterium xiamenense]MCD7059527.1 PQQ-dependent sugar dehydrogenase [Pelagibacterium xiamenense]